MPRWVALGRAVSPRVNASPSSSASVPAWESLGLRAHLASSSVPIDCHDDRSLVGRGSRPAPSGGCRLVSQIAGNSSSSPAPSHGSCSTGAAGQPGRAAALTGSSWPAGARGGQRRGGAAAAGPRCPGSASKVPRRATASPPWSARQRSRPRCARPRAAPAPGPGAGRSPCAGLWGRAGSRRTGPARPGAAGWPSGGCWRWKSRTGRRPRRRGSRPGSRRAVPRTGAELSSPASAKYCAPSRNCPTQASQVILADLLLERVVPYQAAVMETRRSQPDTCRRCPIPVPPTRGN